MPAINNSFEGGTNGTAVSTANSGGASGSAFDAVASAIAGATMAYASDQAAHGSLSLKIATTSTAGQQWVGWTSTFGTQTDYYVRFNLYITAAPAAASTIWRAFSGVTTCLSLNINTSGQLRVLNSSGAVVTGSTSSALPTNQWVRVECHITMSATVGQVEIKTFSSVDGTSATFSAQSAASQTFGAASADGFRLGIQTSQTNFGPMWFDDYALSTTGYPGPAIVPNVVPSVTITAPSYSPLAETVQATASATDSDGTIASYSWAFGVIPAGSTPTLTTPTQATTSFVPLVVGDYNLSCTVTDNSGGQATNTALVHVDAAHAVWNGSSWAPSYELTWDGSAWV